MKQITTKDIAKLLDRNNYRVIVHKTDGGCLTQFPNRIEPPIPRFTRLYQEFTSTGILTCISDESGVELEKNNILCPAYAHKLFTIYNIMLYCLMINYEMSFIKFVLDADEVSEEAFFQAHTSSFMKPDDIMRENTLRNLVTTCFEQGFLPHHKDQAKQEGIHEGLEAIHNLYYAKPNHLNILGEPYE